MADARGEQLDATGASHVLGSDAVQTTIDGVLGDFRIVREIGRGGMGIVYEAEQLSLSRRVALKVLPRARMLDARQLQRFHNEARAAANLHHGNIVPVFAVGSERGVHFYAMQLIDGQTLAQFVERLRREGPTGDVSSLPAVLPVSGDQSFGGEMRPHHREPTDAETVKASVGTTNVTGFNRTYFRAVARVGMQIAEAVEYAHSVGVIHRDIKPSNIILDSQGSIWITDFGLAQFESEAEITLTGELLGTLHYMSPEQSRGEHRNIDGRSDIYSLGATLYELATLQPPFAGANRRELLLKVTSEDPAAPRSLVPEMPRDLETIVLKCTHKDPRSRYATPHELADDLQRYLNDEPIQARRPTLRERGARWVRRHPAWTTSIATAAGIALVVLSLSAVVVARQTVAAANQRVRINQQISETLLELEQAHQQARQSSRDLTSWFRVRELSTRAVDLARHRLASPVLRNRVAVVSRDIAADERDRQLIAQIAEAWESRAEVNLQTSRFHSSTALSMLAGAFQTWGISPQFATPERAVAKIHACPPDIQAKIMEALSWWYDRESLDNATTRWLASVLDSANVGSAAQRRWRLNYRRARRGRDRDELLRLGDSIDQTNQPATYWKLLAHTLDDSFQEHDAAMKLLRRGCKKYPDDFFLHTAVVQLLIKHPQNPAELLRYASVSAALRPENPGAQLNLGYALMCCEKLDQAILVASGITQRHPEYAAAHCNLGSLLAMQGQFERALAEMQIACNMDPDDAEMRCNLGLLYAELGDEQRAIAELKQGVELDPQHAGILVNLAGIYWQVRDLENAEKACRRALEIDPDEVGAYDILAKVQAANGDFAAAAGNFRQVIEREPDSVSAYENLGYCLDSLGDLAGARAAYEHAIELKPSGLGALHKLGMLLLKINDLKGAEQTFRRAIEVDPTNYFAHFQLAVVLQSTGAKDEAIHELQQVLKLQPDDLRVHNNVAVSLCALGQYAESAAIFRNILAVEPNSINARFNFGIVLANQGELDNAAAEFRRISELNPPAEDLNALAWDLVNDAAVGKAMSPQAVEFARAATELAPERADFWNTLGVCLYRAGDFTGAVQSLTKATEMSEEPNVSTWIFLAMAEWKLNHPEVANSWYAKAEIWSQSHSISELDARLQQEADQLLHSQSP